MCLSRRCNTQQLQRQPISNYGIKHATKPVYFDCFPNLEPDCQFDGVIHTALTIHINTLGYNMDSLTGHLYIKYRIHYKAMTLT